MYTHTHACVCVCVCEHMEYIESSTNFREMITLPVDTKITFSHFEIRKPGLTMNYLCL